MVLILGSLLGPECARAQSTETQQLSLEQGENFVSLRVQPEDASLSTIFQGHLGKIHRVKDEQGRVYMPGDSTEQFTTWDPDESYKVYTTSAFDMEVTGTPLSLITAAVPLEKGGNMIPFLPAGPQAVDEALMSISETLLRVENEEENVYEPEGASPSLDSLRAGQGYVLYVDQPDTLTYTIQTATLMEALSLEGMQAGQYIRARGRDDSGDGGGGTFVVTSSECETDGGICFMFDESLTQVTGASSIDHTNLSWRSVEIDYGSDPKDVIDMRHLNGFHGNRAAEFTPWIDLTGGHIVDYGPSILNKLEDNVPTFTGFSYTYGHTSSDRRLERVGVRNSVKPEWWGAPKLDPNNPQKADSYLRWALIAARRIYKDPGSGYDRVWVDIEDGFYFLNALFTPGGTGFRGVGSLNDDGYTRGRLALKPGEALFYRRKDFDPWNDPDRERVYNQMLGLSKGIVTHDYKPDGGLQFKDLWIDGNQRNQPVFQNLSDYEAPNGDSVTQWLQDSGDWSGFYTKGQDIVDGALLGFEDVRMEDLGASGLAVGRFEDLWDVQTSNLNIKDTRRNHFLYGPTGDGLTDITLEGQYWGGNPLYDPRGVTTRSTYTNLTMKNMYSGQFGFNTIIASRGGGLDIDGFTIDLKSSSKSGGQKPGILAVEGLGNTFKNGTIEGYLPENYGPSNNPIILQQRSMGDGDASKNTVVENVTVIDNGVPMQLAKKNDPTTRQLVVKNFEYKVADGVTSSGSDLGTYKLPIKSGATPNDHAWRIYYENFDWKAPTEETFTVGADSDNSENNLPLDWYINSGTLNNKHGYSKFLNPPGGVSLGALTRPVRIFLNDVELRTHTEQNTENTSEFWHRDLHAGWGRMRNCIDKQGRVSDNSGTYTSDADDEGNDFVLIDPGLLSNPNYRTATVTSGALSVTSVEAADPDGTVVDESVRENFKDAQKHVLRVNLDQAIQSGNTITVDWTAKVTPPDQYKTTGLFVARKISGKSYTSGNGPFTYDLRGVASSQESGEKIIYTASSGDASVVTANVQSDDYALELTEQDTGTATITVTGEIPGVGTTQTTFEVTIE